jgi:hypothetical protein
MDTSGEVERIDSLERRVADLEARSRSPQTWRGWFRSLLRWLATTPPLLLFLLVGLDHLSSATSLSLGVLLFGVWASAAVLWAVVEVFAGLDLRFRLTRLILVVAMLALSLGYWQVTIRQPYLAEQHCLASLQGRKGNVHREAVGPGWLIGLIGKTPFQRVVQIELAGPEADERQIGRLPALPHLRCLFLSGPGFDDGMIDDLTAVPGLEQVYLTDSRVTASGVERFRRARPNVQITRQGKIVDGPPQIHLELGLGPGR